MKVIKNSIISGRHKPIVVDSFIVSSNTKKPVIIFCHGYKGFKDWGAWNLMARTFAESGFVFIKFNFSHNGGTITNPIDFPDLEAFGKNNYSIELDDLDDVINWVCTNSMLKSEADLENITLIGHSRGGGIATIKAEEDPRIKRIISLAGVSDFKTRFNENTAEFEQWKTSGVKHVLNGRTKQLMPHYFQFFEDFVNNEKRLTIQRAASQLKIRYLIIHGSADKSVSIDEAHALHSWNTNSILKVIEGANHVFGAFHPWKKRDLPPQLKEVINQSIIFLKN